MIDVWYILGNTANLALLCWFIAASYQDRPIFHFRIGYAFLLVYLFEYELYRELMRWCGFCVPVGPYRLMYLRFLYCMTGMFYREVMLYAEHHKVMVPQNRNSS
jgi:hypothetical protein